MDNTSADLYVEPDSCTLFLFLVIPFVGLTNVSITVTQKRNYNRGEPKILKEASTITIKLELGLKELLLP